MTHFSKSKEEILISYQVLRIEKFSKGDLGKIGAETERTARRPSQRGHRQRAHAAQTIISKNRKAASTRNGSRRCKASTRPLRKQRKPSPSRASLSRATRLSSRNAGYVPGEPLPLELQKFFADSYAFFETPNRLSRYRTRYLRVCRASGRDHAALAAVLSPHRR